MPPEGAGNLPRGFRELQNTELVILADVKLIFTTL